MPVVKELRNAGDHWNEIVEPDFCDHQANQADLRRALHCAVSLNHMADWVYENHETAVRSAFSFHDHKGNPQRVTDAATFANALEQQTPDFGRIRGIANAAKHYKLKSVRPVAHAPSHAANTRVTGATWNNAAWDDAKWDDPPSRRAGGCGRRFGLFSNRRQRASDVARPECAAPLVVNALIPFCRRGCGASKQAPQRARSGLLL